MLQTWSVRIRSLVVVAGAVLLATPLLSVEERPFVGIELGSPTDGGVSVTGVIPNTAAERFGLQIGDVILRIDETATESPGSITNARPASRRASRSLRAAR